MCNDLELPLIVETAKKPFLPGRQIFAIYKDHFVIAITRLKSDLPEAIYKADGATAWETLPRTRKVSVIPFEDVDWIKTYESGDIAVCKFTLTITSQGKDIRIDLASDLADAILTFIAERFKNKLEPKAETAVEARRKLAYGLIAYCLAIDIWIAWALWELYTTQSISGPKFIVSFIWLIYEKRGFATTATLTLFTTALFNFTILMFLFSRPNVKNQVLNCNNCGYNLLGQTGNTCPECGSDVNSKKLP